MIRNNAIVIFLVKFTDILMTATLGNFWRVFICLSKSLQVN